MLLIGYFEGIDSERGLEWRCADSLSREFLRLSERERVRIVRGSAALAAAWRSKSTTRFSPGYSSVWPSMA